MLSYSLSFLSCHFDLFLTLVDVNHFTHKFPLKKHYLVIDLSVTDDNGDMARYSINNETSWSRIPSNTKKRFRF